MVMPYAPPSTPPSITLTVEMPLVIIHPPRAAQMMKAVADSPMARDSDAYSEEMARTTVPAISAVTRNASAPAANSPVLMRWMVSSGTADAGCRLSAVAALPGELG